MCERGSETDEYFLEGFHYNYSILPLRVTSRGPSKSVPFREMGFIKKVPLNKRFRVKLHKAYSNIHISKT